MSFLPFVVQIALFESVNPHTSTSTKPTRPVTDRPRRKPPLRRFIPWTVGAGLIALIVAGFWPKPIEVEVATVTKGPLTVSVLEEGKTRIRHRYIVSMPITGFLRRVELRAGAPIEAGKTVLATIEPQASSFLDPRARAEAEARLQAAEAGEKRAQAEVDRAQSALDLAVKDRERAEELKTTGAISVKEWDAAQSQADVLERAVRATEFALQVAQFEKSQAKAALMQVEKPGTNDSVEPLTILAPVSGYVLKVQEESARLLTAGSPIMEVGDPTDLEAEIELLSSDAIAVQPGAEVSIEQWGGEQPLRGTVVMVEPGGFTKISALGVEEQRVIVRVNFVDPIPASHPLGDRYRVEARIVVWHADDVLRIPTGALFRRGNNWMTFVVDGGHARLTKVEIDHHNGIDAEVTGGVSEGQAVILHPSDTVADGTSVKARKSSSL